ncbi:MAG: hypothetical protein C5B54_09385 [Acidobacteria bacterium]|nr:MAG: hypothetical protein C5B54_09385 [Acidobacteriota bacterium]
MDAPLIRTLAGVHKSTMQKDALTHGVPYGSDLRFFTNYAKMQAVLYGPGDVALAHSLNEHVPMDEVLGVAEVIANFLLEW